MKQLFTLLVFVAATATVSGQWWFDAGVKGAFGPTLMYDDNVFDHGFYKHKLTAGHAFGARLGFNYGYHAGLSLEYSAASSKQDFELNSDLYNTFNWKHNDIIGVFRYSGNGAYVEIGGKLSSIKEVTVENVNSNNPVDITDQFTDNYTSGIFGFGSYLAGSELLSVNIGIRLHWGFTDMLNDAGTAAELPFYQFDQVNYDPDVKTFATAAQLQLELNYAFGRFSKTACSDRWRLILFQ